MKERTGRMSILRRLAVCSTVGLVGASAVVGYAVGRYRDNRAATANADMRLVRTVLRPESNDECERALVSLMKKRPARDSWIVLLLANQNTLGAFRNVDPHTEARLAEIDRATIAIVLDELNDNESSAVLWAVSELLEEEGYGRTSGTVGVGPFKMYWDGATKPLRDMAREVLVRNLGVDRGYDQVAWRDEILRGGNERSR